MLSVTSQFCFFDNLDATALKSSRKPRVARCARMRENLVQFSSKQENQARIITIVNNQYQNYQVSLNYFFCHIIFETTNCIDKRYHLSIVSCPVLPLQRHLGRNNKRCKVIDSVSDETKTFWQYIFFSTNHLETHAICSIINKIYSDKRMAPNNKWKFLTPLMFFSM